jgi:hypothetical protein
VAAGITEGRAHTEGTHQKQTADWEKWLLYLQSIELDNDHPQKLKLLVPPLMLWQRPLENKISKVRFTTPMDQNASKSDSY